MRFLGIPVSVDQSAVILFVLTMTWGNAIVGHPAPLPLLILGGAIVTAILLFSLLFHERAHIWASARYGIGCRGIIIHGFGGVALLNGFPNSPGKYFFVAAAGPLSSLLLAGAGKILYVLLPVSGMAASSLSLFVSLNLIFAIFNCIPVFPLDGGRMLHAGLWRFKNDHAWAQNWAILIARVVIIGLLFFSLFQFAQGTLPFFSLLWRFVLGFLIWNMHKRSH